MAKKRDYTFYIGPTVDYVVDITEETPEVILKRERAYDENASLKEPVAENRKSEVPPNLEVFKNISDMMFSPDKETKELAMTWLKEGENLFDHEIDADELQD